MSCNIELLIVGSTPESAGVGGVTVHVERLIQYLKRQGFPYDLFDYKRESLFGIIGRIRTSKIVHLHICNPYYMFLVALICRFFRKKYVLTLHGKYAKSEQKPWALIQYCIRKASVPIVLNQTSYDTCICINPRTALIPAFIPPQTQESLELDVKGIVDSIRAKGKKIAVTYGFDDSTDINGREIYGISFLIPIFNENNDYALIVANPTGCYKRKFAHQYPNVFFIDHPLSLFELLKLSDVFVRNTSKDGDSLSVKEALFLHKKVICTDVIERPKGVYLFSYSDKNSFLTCLNADSDCQRIMVESGEDKILELYQKLI